MYTLCYYFTKDGAFHGATSRSIANSMSIANIHFMWYVFVVRPILMTLSCQGMGARDVVQIVMNHFP
jgi:hypothetical protein